jgi:hypothetical protein
MKRISWIAFSAFVLAITSFSFIALAAATYTVNIDTPTVTNLNVSLTGTASGNQFAGNVGQYNVLVDWGDGMVSETSTISFTETGQGNDKAFSGTWSNSHDYATGGTKTITVKLYHGNTSGNEASPDQIATIQVTPTAPVSTGAIVVSKNVMGSDGTTDIQDTHSFSVSINGDGATTLAEGTTATFSNLNAGTYTITEATDAGYDFVSAMGTPAGTSTSNGVEVSVTAGATTTVSIVNKLKMPIDTGTTTATTTATTTSSLAGTIFNDTNANGVKDEGELGLSGWIVDLGGALTATTSSNGSGAYSFSGLADGFYTLCAQIPSSAWTQSTTSSQNISCGDVRVGYGINVSSTTNPSGYDFGHVSTSTATTTPDTGTTTPETATSTGRILVIKRILGFFGQTDETDSNVFTVSLNGTSTQNFSQNNSVYFNDLTPGTYTITEGANSNLRFVSATSDNTSTTTDNGVTVFVTANATTTVTISNQKTTDSSSGNGGSTGGGSINPGLITSGGIGSVLGAATTTTNNGVPVTPGTCNAFINSYIKYGSKNNADDVKKLQQFLNEYLGTNLPITGFYGPLTRSAVLKFQVNQQTNIIEPWAKLGLLPRNIGTGYVYKTTKWQINSLRCPGVSIPFPQLP